MLQNVGSLDRWVRAIVGLVIVSLVFWGPQTPWGYLGLIPIATAAFSWCPLYAMFGLSTCATARRAST